MRKTPELRVTDHVTPAEDKAISEQLKAYSNESFGISDRKELAINLHDATGNPEGGLIGRTGRGWLYVQMLFVPEHRRGHGLASQMLTMAEQEAKARGCLGSYLDTINPQALRLYRKQGYEVIGQLEDLTGGHSITWLKKRF